MTKLVADHFGNYLFISDVYCTSEAAHYRKKHLNIQITGASHITINSQHLQLYKTQRIIYIYVIVGFEWYQLSFGSFWIFSFHFRGLVYVGIRVFGYFIIIIINIVAHHYIYWKRDKLIIIRSIMHLINRKSH